MISRFESSRFDRKPVYICRICKKQTRDTGHDERSLELCAYCMQEAELENALNDGGIDERQFNDRLAELQKQYKRGAFEKKTKTTKPEQKFADQFSVAEAEGISPVEVSPVTEDIGIKPAAKKTTKRTSSKSRAPEAKRARKIIRNYLRASIYLAFALELGDEAETEAASEAYELAHAALSTLAGYEDTDIIR